MRNKWLDRLTYLTDEEVAFLLRYNWKVIGKDTAKKDNPRTGVTNIRFFINQMKKLGIK